MILPLLLLLFMAQLSSTPKPEDVGVPLLGSVEGVVVDPQGKPVDGAWVYAVGDAEGKIPINGRWPSETSTTTDSEGKFVLGRVVVDNPVHVWASKDSDYYA